MRMTRNAPRPAASQASNRESRRPTELAPERREVVGSFFRAAAALFRAKPADLIAHERAVFAVRSDELGLTEETALALVRHGEAAFGLLVFRRLADYDAFWPAVRRFESEQECEMPPHLALYYERVSEIDAAEREELAGQHWEIAGPDAYPWLVGVGGLMETRTPTIAEFVLAESLVRGLTTMLREHPVLRDALEGRREMSRTIEVTTSGGPVALSLRVPYSLPYGGALQSPSHDLRSSAPPTPSLDTQSSARSGWTLALPAALRRIFDEVPQRLRDRRAAAESVARDLRGFSSFLGRELGFATVDTSSGVLDADLSRRLEAALLASTPSELGGEPSPRERVIADPPVRSLQPLRVIESNRGPLVVSPLSGPARESSASTSSPDKSKRTKRKAERKARRKNR